MIGLFRKLWVVLLVNTLLIGAVFGQNNYNISHYNSKNGLPQNDINSMVVDSFGYVWTISDLGVVRFDGLNFKEFNISNINDFIGTYFISFYQTATHELLAADIYGSLFSIQNGKIVSIKKGDIDALNYIETNGVLPSSDFYIKYTTPFFRTAKDSAWTYAPLTIFPQSKTDYLIKTLSGIAVYKNNSFITTIQLNGYNPKHFFCLGPTVYFIDADKSVYYFDLDKLTILRCSANLHELTRLPDSTLNELKVFNDYTNKTAYLISEFKLFKFSATNVPNILTTNYLTDSLPRNTNITSISYSKQHQFLALSTNTNGIYIFKEKQFVTLTNATSKSGATNGYYSQAEVDSNTLLTDWQLDFTINGSQPAKYPIKRNNEENILKDKQGNFFYSKGDSLLKYSPAKNSFKLIAYLNGNRAVTFYQQGDSIIVGCLKTLAYIKNDTLITIVTLGTKQSNINPYSAFYESENRLWFTTIKGAYCYNTQSKLIDTIRPLYKKMVHNVVLHDAFILLGTYGGGYYFYKQGKTVQMPMDKNNYLQSVHAFVFDKNGFVWMTTNRGIFKTKFEQLTNYFNDTTTKVNFYYYNETDGLSNSEFNGGCPSAALKLKNGYVSLTTMEGLVWYKPDSFIDDFTQSPIFIDGVYIDNRKTVNLKNLNAKIENIRFEISSPYWGNPDNEIIEYNLDGYSRQWKTLSSQQNNIEFSNLRSGNYTLKLRKKFGFADKDYVTQSISFSIEKKFYETIWFQILALFLIIGLVAAIARLYAANIASKNKNLELKVQQRTNELEVANEQLHNAINVKDKLISIVSHDIVTPLRFISLVARKSLGNAADIDKEIIYNSMVDIKNASEKLHGNAQNILNWIKQHNNRFKVTITHVAISSLADEVATTLTELAKEKETQIINEISHDDIIKTDKNILGIILNNLISNAIKFTKNGTITLMAFEQNNTYCIKVKDTGFGIKPEKLEHIQSIIDKQNINAVVGIHGDGNNGLGYLIITELIELINGKINIQSTPDAGTTITLVLPLQSI